WGVPRLRSSPKAIRLHSRSIDIPLRFRNDVGRFGQRPRAMSKTGEARSATRGDPLPARPAALSLVTTTGFADYALLDSGRGRKLERFGAVIVDRPEPQAMWQPRLPSEKWSAAHAVFSG